MVGAWLSLFGLSGLFHGMNPFSLSVSGIVVVTGVSSFSEFISCGTSILVTVNKIITEGENRNIEQTQNYKYCLMVNTKKYVWQNYFAWNMNLLTIAKLIIRVLHSATLINNFYNQLQCQYYHLSIRLV